MSIEELFDREQLARAWDEGVEYVADGMYDTTEWLKANPYRQNHEA
jgi:hypothetical protein